MWREKIKNFINKTTDPAKRKDMMVLCFPGAACLEIPLYLALGFLPENIIGVESGIVNGKIDQGVIAAFKENAQKYGIQTRIGKLEKLIAHETTVFDIISLDFLGPWNSTYAEIINSIKHAPEFRLLTNFQ